MNEILRFMQKRDERTDGRTYVRKAFYNLPTTAFGRREIIIVDHTKWVLQKYPVNACGVRDHRWPVWGYVGDESAQSI